MTESDKLYSQEQKYLNYAQKALVHDQAFHQQQMIDLPKIYSNDPRMMEVLMSISATRLRRLSRLEDKPYFARIDFKATGEKPEKLYIGKTSIADEQGGNAVIDWRAPVSSLYYDSNLGQSSYLAPSGEITGDLLLKRQFVIEKEKIAELYDVDSVSNDELLQPYLGANADNRLKTIVASIGKEQNEIIRWFSNRNLVVQGVAGSGKTTVALHRAAYLLYHEKERWSPEQLMVIGPNNYFIHYIATLLPDIEAEEIGQEVFEEIVRSYCGEKFKNVGSSIVLDGLFDGSVDPSIQQYKASMAYKDALDGFYCDLVSEATSFPLLLQGVQLMSSQELTALFQEQGDGLYLRQRVKNTIRSASLILRERSNILSLRIRNNLEPKVLAAPLGDERMALLNQMHAALREVENGCPQILAQYFSGLNLTVTAFLKLFAKSAKDYLPQNISGELFSAEFTKALNKKQLLFEDAPALLYTKLLLFGQGDYANFRHVFIDEAQDLGIFHFYCIKRLFSDATFTIVGDLAQGIYSYRSIKDWHTLIQEIFGGVAEYKELTKSYRTTIQIMSAANLALEALGATSAVPIIRNGDKPRLVRGKSKGFPQHILETVEKYKAQGLVTFAIITKNKKQATKLFKELSALRLACGIIDENTTTPEPISILTGYQAKGLEFDMVFITQCDSNNYVATSAMDMRLLFVAMSRSLHQLELLIPKENNPPLETFTEEYFQFIQS